MSDKATDAGATKAELRAALRLKLQAMTAEDRDARSATIRDRILKSEPWKNARSVLLFNPLSKEPDIAPLKFAAEADEKATHVVPSTIRLESELQLPFTPDLILVPGLAFSRDRHRLGRGGGFYDRFLCGRGATAFKLAVCFSFQLFDQIPIEPHDALMDLIVTD